MEPKFLKDEKNEAEIQLDLTIAELLRAYLAKDSDVEFVAWKRKHIESHPILKIKTKGKTARKAISDAISQIEKQADKLVKDFKKAK